jgi:uncharacterized protein (DUF2236 family)
MRADREEPRMSSGDRPTLPLEDAELIARAGIENLPRDPADGFFQPGCWLHRVSRDPAIVLGGGRALLLEVAHPVVAAGVAEHSNFRRDPFGRMQRTLRAMSAITFEDRASGFAAVRAIERVHASVRGAFTQEIGVFRAGTPYSAADPHAMRWVWATLVDTAVAVYRLFVGDLSDDALDAYYTDHTGVARLLGIPGAILPASWPEFERWFESVIDGEELAVDDRAREIADAVLHAPLPEANTKAVRILTTALLPERLREAFGLDWNDAKAERFAALVRSVRGLRRQGGAVDAEPDRG